MVAPVFQREGARAGGLTATGFSVVCRTDSNGADIDVKVYTDPNRQNEDSGYSTTAGTLGAGNNYQDTVHVTGLTADTKYWWELVATDGGAGSTTGTEATFSAGKLRTHATKDRTWKCQSRACFPFNGMQQFNSACQEIVTDRTYRMARKPDFCFQIGDIYYGDQIGQTTTFDTTLLNPAVFDVITPADHAGAVANGEDGYRTTFMNTYSLLSYAPTAGYKAEFSNRTQAYPNVIAEMALIPTYYMWDDHDRAFDNCEDRANAAGDEATRWDLGRDVGHESFMTLQEKIIEADTDSTGSTRAWVPKTNEDSYYVFDAPPCRFIVLDTRSFRNNNGINETSSKTMLGTEQFAWFKDRIDDNTQKYVCIISGVMLDGNHGWDNALFDVWRGFQYARMELLDYIWDNGDPQRTFFITGDTHESCVAKYRGPNLDKTPIYEFMAGNAGWSSDVPGYINGWREDNGLTGSTGLGGWGGELQHMGLGNFNMVEVEAQSTKLVVTLHSTYAHSDSDSKVGPLYSRIYK